MHPNLKRWKTSLQPCGVDRLSSLPDELLSQILSMLPTKDVAAMQVLSKSMRRRAFTLIACVDLEYPHLVDRFPLFNLFVDDVLHKLSQSGQPLTRFRFGIGGDKTSHICSLGKSCTHDCYGDCYPVIEPSRLSTWLSYPFVLRGLRELDLFFHVSSPSHCEVPPGIFACQSLEVLKLDSNLKLNGAEIFPVFLPNLKLLHLRCFSIVEDFITRLVSSCPSLEDLAVCNCWWDLSNRLIISSHSLRRLELIIRNRDQDKYSDLVLIDTPNLQYFDYDDNLASRYSITTMNALIQATITIWSPLPHESNEISLQIQLNLFRVLSNVQRLSLLYNCVENMYYGGEFKDQMPVFHHLKTLELGPNIIEARWDKLLLDILTCSPSLETLVFPEGLFVNSFSDASNPVVADLEDQGWKTKATEAIPQCLKSSLKQIVIKEYFGITREFNLLKFFLSKASLLQELVVICLSPPSRCHVPKNDHMLFETTLKDSPRASTTCLIRVVCTRT
ncbi:F-box/LRR-repeat protein At4g14103-like [Silene latifolia]|uniref:F-box/LRR-repeat protein At4g14103-like n=1 Tax=Silene latifolia TaxID=37657 RepID=UPI003D77E98F